jgi:hypothetical protein
VKRLLFEVFYERGDLRVRSLMFNFLPIKAKTRGAPVFLVAQLSMK